MIPPEIARNNVLDDEDRRVLDRLQRDFPLVPAPFEVLAAELGATEADLLDRIRRLRTAKAIRQISAIFDTRMLGYGSTLAAMRLDPARLDEAAAVVSGHPGVSHNYAREHAFNLWFTLAVPPGHALDAHLDALHRLTAAESTRAFPTLRLFKIGVRLDFGSGLASGAEAEAPSSPSEAREPPTLTSADLAVVREAQADLELTPRPFDALADRAGMTVEAFLSILRDLGDRQVMRRFAAVLHHRRVGYTANGMGIWPIPEDRIEEAGARFARRPEVSHCYHRPSYPDWPYTIFTMVHAPSREACEAVLAEMSRESGFGDYRVLFSTTEYKKVRVTYFDGAVEAWAAANGM